MYELLKTLCELPGPLGDEGTVQNFLADRWSSRVESLEFKGVGNLVARVGGSGPKLLVAAHADELCFVVRHISEDGFLWITSGQIDRKQKPSLRGSEFLPWGHPALVLTAEHSPVEGLFATLTGHVLTPEQREKGSFDWEDIFVDIGAASHGEATERGVRVGDRVIWNPPTRRMGSLAYGKAMDDRVGLAMMDRLLDVLDRDHLAYELIFASTVQEEIGLIGAYAIAQELDCEIGLALDVGLVGDVPGVDERQVSAKLGGGPIVVHKDLSSYNRRLVLDLIRTAEENDIPVQPAVFSVYGTDASAFTRFGMRAAPVVVPCRYTHSPFEMLDLNDVERTVDLLKAFLERPSAGGEA